MTQITCSRRIEFDAAHRVMGHEGKCKDVHGHRYVIEATFEAGHTNPQADERSPERAVLDNLGRVIDFGEIRKILGDWVNANWDHNTILFDQDKTLGRAIGDVTKQTIFYLPFNPTAENMARYLLETICPKLFGDLCVRCVSIRLYETPNCFAEALIGGSL